MGQKSSSGPSLLSGGRVVSANYNGWLGPDYPLDVQGIDYATSTYDKVHAGAPKLPAISSETSSAVSDRGEYANDQAKGHVAGYDTQARTGRCRASSAHHLCRARGHDARPDECVIATA